MMEITVNSMLNLATWHDQTLLAVYKKLNGVKGIT